MTEQEAEVLAERLTRVWGLENTLSSGWTLEEEMFDWFAHWSKDVSLRLTSGRGSNLLDASLSDDNRYIFLSYFGQMTVGPTQENSAQFIAQWLPFFRRGCWLSGCRVEATAHEKAEWMQGFTREELEAWNLKM